MGVLAANQHRSIHMLKALLRRSIKTWGPLSACMPSSCATTWLNHCSTRLLINGQTHVLYDNALALPVSHSGVLLFSRLSLISKRHQLGINRTFHTNFCLLSSTEPKSTDKPNSSSESQSDFKVIYRYPFIRGLYFINRLKIFQTMLTVIYLPLVFHLHSLKKITDFAVIGQTGITLFALIMLYYISYYIRRVVGIIYINKAEDKLKIAHMTFWGKRKNEIIPVSDVIPFSEAGESRGEMLKKIKVQGTDNQFFYIDRRYGNFVNEDKFKEVFGNF